MSTTSAISGDIGRAIPDMPHAISVSLPSWRANIGYEEGEEWVVSKMKNGYPRFFINSSIESFAKVMIEKLGQPEDLAMLFPSSAVAARCLDFLEVYSEAPVAEAAAIPSRGRILDLILVKHGEKKPPESPVVMLSAVIYPQEYAKRAREFWQHSGEGCSSRRAEFCHRAFKDGYMVFQAHGTDIHDHEGNFPEKQPSKGPRRYQPTSPRGRRYQEQVRVDNDAPPNRETNELHDYLQFVEERFGRNLNMALAKKAKLAIRRRIAGSLTIDVDLSEAVAIPAISNSPRCEGFSEQDVFLFPTGMSSIFNTHRILLQARGSQKSIIFGFPYIDTLKVLEKWGPGCLFYGHGSSAELDDLQYRCLRGERFLALFCEFPGNPLLTSPDLSRIRALAQRFDFLVVVDETIGNFINIHILPSADIVVSSLTKIFSGDSNVMGGSCVLNPQGKSYSLLKDTFVAEYKDEYWFEDAVYMERNSRDFVSRIERININAELICDVLSRSKHTKQVYYPKSSASRPFYDQHRRTRGGYGGLLSVTFHSTEHAIAFFDGLDIAKGPSLGTNFTLCCPYALLAHYHELDWAAKFGVEADLIRISVGLEDPISLISKFEQSLAALGKMFDKRE